MSQSINLQKMRRLSDAEAGSITECHPVSIRQPSVNEIYENTTFLDEAANNIKQVRYRISIRQVKLTGKMQTINQTSDINQVRYRTSIRLMS